MRRINVMVTAVGLWMSAAALREGLQSLSIPRATNIEPGSPMIAQIVNYAYRLALALSYPMLCRVERAIGIRSDAVVVAVWHRDRLLVVRHSYMPGVALPGGTLKRGETPIWAAVREIGEEVGISVNPDELTLVRSWKQREGTRWLFEFRPSVLPNIVPDQREVVAARLLPRSEIPAGICLTLKQGA